MILLIYIQKLPLTDSAMQVSISKEADSWFAAAGVYEEKIEDIDKAIETLLYLNQKHPDHYLMPQSLYQLVKLYQKKGEQQLSDYNKQQLMSQYPESGYAKILSDPQYLQTVARRKEDALRQYDNVVASFNAGNYQQATTLSLQAQKEYADLSIMPNLIYMEARSYGRMHNTDMMRERLEYLLEKYPNSALVKPAQDKLDALATGHFDTKQFELSPNSKHAVLAIVADTAATKTGQLKFHLMKYCADNGLNRMDVEEDKDLQSGDIRALLVTYFDNKEQSKIFCDGFTKQNEDFLNGGTDIKIMAVSEENLRRIHDAATIEAYYNFYIGNY